MNIFVLSLQIIECAMFHCDQHVVKMILESAQMLCTACILSGGKAGYRVVHQKHPCNLWILKSLSNWRWLRDLASALNDEFKFRYNRTVNHKSFDVISELEEPNIEDKGLTPFSLAMPEEFKDPDPVQAYRNYYAGAKYKFATWKNREIPEWYIELREAMGGDAESEVKALLTPGNSKEKRKESKELKSELAKKNKIVLKALKKPAQANKPLDKPPAAPTMLTRKASRLEKSKKLENSLSSKPTKRKST